MSVNDGYVHSETINQRGAARRLDAYLGDRYRHSTVEEWQAHITAERVRIDGTPASADALLRIGQVVEWHRPPWE
ncbi:MAG: 23S rRNA pseudouridine1911/1915/1917 synthase, partial [Myxococcota bacterium]